MDSSLENVAPDAPLRLSIAAKLAFPHGSMTASGLRREAARGRLRIERIAGKDFTTLEEIKRMRELCRVQAKERDYTCVPSAGIKKAILPSEPIGSSGMVRSTSPRDALRMKLEKLRER